MHSKTSSSITVIDRSVVDAHKFLIIGQRVCSLASLAPEPHSARLRGHSVCGKVPIEARVSRLDR